MIIFQRKFFVILLLSMPTWSASHLYATEWFVDPSFRLKGEYNDNLTLTSLPHDEVWGVWNSPGIKFGSRTESFEFSGSAQADFVRYEGNQPVEFTNLFFPLSVSYKGETNKIGLAGRFVRDNTLQGELQETGIVNIFRQRNQGIINPSWEHQITERLFLNTNYQFMDVDYESGATRLFPYQVHAVTGGLGYLLTERTTVNGTLFYGNFHVPDQAFRSIYYGIQVQGTHSVTETLHVSILGGIRRVENSIALVGTTLRDHSTVWIASGTIKKELETIGLEGSISRELSPSGRGLLVQTDKMLARINYQISEQVQTHLAGQYFWVSSLNDQNSLRPFPDRSYWSVETGVTWQFSEWWNLEGSYRHRRRNQGNSSIESTGNIFTLALNFKGWTWSSAQ